MAILSNVLKNWEADKKLDVNWNDVIAPSAE